MDRYEGILENIARYVELTEEEKEQFTSIIKVSRIKKRQFVIQPGYVCEHRNYIVKGAFRVFYLDDKGKEHTVSIGVEDWYFTDFYSYINQLPAEHFAEALEDSVILQLKYEDIEGLCRKIHSLSEYFRLITEKAFASSRSRVISNNSKTSEERYVEYAKKYPQIVNRVPQYVIASYLGISAEFLSKIRARR
ncbi:Crp/Fnr family transcriptional regulator [uncultured Tenacibaculum sp.]|uniref:Crp/Fnr family transcriptional regulator n=1 Tax=uncultured Tenacibaculum sp. TaxID=174713 RepID=UPI002613EB9C|nr:Crp/Fnr family transcriptional regulator [uncultured Tenacibaculum sp.]